MLDLISELCKNAVGNIPGVLSYKVNSDALRSDELNYLLYLVHQDLGSIRKKKVCFIEEEYHLGLVEVADFGKCLE